MLVGYLSKTAGSLVSRVMYVPGSERERHRQRVT
eukprot:COSAG03_NODE_23017_length_284_cov_0.821622_1_plen_33_part_10